MMPLMKEIEINCNLVIEAVSEICSNQVIIEKTITDIYNFIQRNKNQVSYMRPLVEMLNSITSQQNEKFINDVSKIIIDILLFICIVCLLKAR